MQTPAIGAEEHPPTCIILRNENIESVCDVYIVLQEHETSLLVSVGAVNTSKAVRTISRDAIVF